ncbi:NAD-dependent epimerase/dehydratase family protein [Herbiconiux sp. L3-i23]|uniref:NAD-dependent epimerase/dehydratase family protein n=1 Tax=Herbiconiux sp. L3-i23 TaxID=2905871 RepID=UPI002060CD15|nr:NAD-dependent epimerase/dehydratase family protein [Herbiconiux sp. L3-i23]BDI23667.1 NAD-dependent epimerase [Herbiconiux sp. L3-i23]
MKIIVTGATGNVGLGVLRRLAAASEVDEIVGIARRAPHRDVAEYEGVRFDEITVGEPGSLDALTRSFEGADAVIHLAWKLQPNRDEAELRRTNVDGTVQVLEAVARAGVPQVVVASSVGAYSPGPKRSRVDESWPTGGIPSSHYSRHKAMDERALDRFEREHPEIVVTRARPGLVMNGRTGAELKRLFARGWLPLGWLDDGVLPVLPMPTTTVSQVIHVDDLADGIWRTIDRRAGGAFNFAAEPVADPTLVASVLGTRTVPFRAAVLRALVAFAWRTRIIAMDPGWIDIATTVPVMSTARARAELGWVPKVSAHDALAEVVHAVAEHRGLPASPPLHGQK